jgi:chemotaxis signal transduction protein
VNRLNGAVQVFSQPGRGTTFQLTLPLTLAVAKVLLVEAGGEWVALPADLVERVEVVDAERLAHVEGRGLSTFSGEVLPLVSLAEFLDLSPVRLVRSAHTACLVRQGKQAAALLVDRVVEHTQAVIRDLGPLLPHVAYCMGVTFYEGRALLIVDVGSLLRALPQERTADAQAARIVVVTDAAERFAAWHRAAWDLALPLSLVAADATRFVPLAHARVVAVDGRMTGLAAWLAAWSGRLGAAHRVILAARDTARELDLAVLYRSGFGEVLDPADVPALLRRLRLLAAHDEGTP